MNYLMRTRHFVPLFLFFIGMFIMGCNNVNAPENQVSNNAIVLHNSGVNLSKNSSSQLSKTEAINLLSDMKIIAKSLALLLNDIEYRKILEKEISEADNRENIIDFSKFLKNEIFILKNGKSTKSSIIAELINNNVDMDSDSKKVLQKFQSLEPCLIDIYFPVPDHRVTWRSNSKNLLVAVSDPRERKKEDGKIFSYDLDGKQVMLSAKTAPSVPVIVVALSETHGIYPPKAKNTDFVTNPTVYSILPPPIEPDKVTKNDLFVHSAFLRDPNFDGWFGGAPELYTYVQFYGYIDNVPGYMEQYTEFPEVINEHYYILDRLVFHAQGNLSPMERCIKWMDRDGGFFNGDDEVESYWGPADSDHDSYNQFIYATNFLKIWWGKNDDLWMENYENVYFDYPD